MPVIETDPRVQALFDENTATMRRANAEITATLKADQDRLAAEAKARDERYATAQAEAAKSAEDLAKAGEKPKKPQWERPERGAGEMSFGPEDDEEPVRAAVPPPPAPQVAPPPRPAPRRPAPVDDDDDMSGQTWLS